MNSNFEYSVISFSNDLIKDKFVKRDKSLSKDIDWIKSVFVFIFPYQFETVKENSYLTAKFAYGRDYHLILKDRLAQFIDSSDNGFDLEVERNEILIDINFLDEKKCATLAGLGRVGKNNLLLTPRFGSRVVIGTIISYKEIDTLDSIIDDVCISCDKCIRRCPTNALRDGFIREDCLSYLSQYLSNNYELYDKMSLSFGCDVCQDVCPVNKTNYQIDLEFNYNEKSMIDLEFLKTLTSKTYKIYYEDKNFNWIGYLKMLRNILQLEVNNNNIEIEEIEYFQKKHKDVPWFTEHLDYMKKKVGNNGT